MLHHPTPAFGPPSTSIANPADEDAALIALCRIALRTIDEEQALEKASFALEDEFRRVRPPYPKLAWRYSPNDDTAPQLRDVLKNEGARKGVEWRKNMRAQIAAVTARQRQIDGLYKSLGMDKAGHRHARAAEDARKHVTAVADIPAETIVGASYKSLTVTAWIRAGYTLTDIGEQLALSIVDDVRRLGAAEKQERKHDGVWAELH